MIGAAIFDFCVSSPKLFCFCLFLSLWVSSCASALICVAFANELLVLFVLGGVVLVVGSFVAVVGVVSVVVAVVAMRLLEIRFGKFCDSAGFLSSKSSWSS